jgi:hypothetical protein
MLMGNLVAVVTEEQVIVKAVGHVDWETSGSETTSVHVGEKPVVKNHNMLEPTQAGNPGFAAGGGTLKRLPGCWGGPLTNLLLTGVMPQPHSGPTLPQCERDDMSLVACNVDGELIVRGAASVTAEQLTQKIEKNCGHVDGETSGSAATCDKKVVGHVGHVDGESSDSEVTSEKKKMARHVDGDTSAVSQVVCNVDGATSDGQMSDSVPSPVEVPRRCPVDGQMGGSIQTLEMRSAVSDVDGCIVDGWTCDKVPTGGKCEDVYGQASDRRCLVGRTSGRLSMGVQIVNIDGKPNDIVNAADGSGSGLVDGTGIQVTWIL